MERRPNIRWETSVGSALSGSRREERWRGPGRGRAAAPVRVGDDGRVRAGVPGRETYGGEVCMGSKRSSVGLTTLTNSSSESSLSMFEPFGERIVIAMLLSLFSIASESAVWDRRTSCKRLMVVEE
jgi:hypothetical protein